MKLSIYRILINRKKNLEKKAVDVYKSLICAEMAYAFSGKSIGLRQLRVQYDTIHKKIARLTKRIEGEYYDI